MLKSGTKLYLAQLRCLHFGDSSTLDKNQVYKNIKNKIKKRLPQKYTGELTRMVDMGNVFLGSDTTNWSYKPSNNRVVRDDKFSSYRVLGRTQNFIMKQK